MSDGPVTPYASFSTASRELASNGGAWFVAINSEVIGATTIISHQSMGGMTELIQLTSAMGAWLDIPSSVAQIGDITSGSSSFNACEVKLDGDTRAGASFNGWSIPFCPMSNPIIFRVNPTGIFLSTEKVQGTQTTVYIGNFQYTQTLVGLPPRSSSTSSPAPNTGAGAGSSAGNSNGYANSNPTPTGSSAVVSSATTGFVNSTQTIGGLTTVTLPNGGTTIVPVFLPTKSIPSFTHSPTNSANISSSALDSKDAKSAKVGVLIGGVLGGIILLGMMIFLILSILRRKRRDEETEAEKLENSVRSGDMPASGDTNDPNSSERVNHVDFSNQYDHPTPTNSNFVNLVSALGLDPPPAGRHVPGPGTLPPSYISHDPPPQPNTNGLRRSIPLPPPPPPQPRSGGRRRPRFPNNSRPVDAI